MFVLGMVVVSDFIPANMEISIHLVPEGLPPQVLGKSVLQVGSWWGTDAVYIPNVTCSKKRGYSKGHTSLRKKTTQHFRIHVLVNILGVTIDIHIPSAPNTL